MLTIEQMLVRLAIALVLGAILGVEREIVHKEAGVRTEMLVAGGSAIFTMIALSLPYIVSAQAGDLNAVISGNSGWLMMIANIVVGIGFLGAGLIIKTDNRARGITTAALVWMTAAIGISVAVGLIEFATIAAISITIILYLLRRMNLAERWDDEIPAASKH